MGTQGGYWSGKDDDHVAARFGAEHSIVSMMTDDVLEMNAGNEALLPPWPPAIQIPGLAPIPMPAGRPAPETAVCAHCDTLLAMREGEWRHEKGYKERGGCNTASPTG